MAGPGERRRRPSRWLPNMIPPPPGHSHSACTTTRRVLLVAVGRVLGEADRRQPGDHRVGVAEGQGGPESECSVMVVLSWGDHLSLPPAGRRGLERMGTPSRSHVVGVHPARAVHSRVRWAWSAYPPAAATTASETRPRPRAPPAARGCARTAASRWYSFGASPHSARTRSPGGAGCSRPRRRPAAHAGAAGQPGQRPPDLGARLGGAVPGQRGQQGRSTTRSPRRATPASASCSGRCAQAGSERRRARRAPRRARRPAAQQRPGAGRRQGELDAASGGRRGGSPRAGVQPGDGRPARAPRAGSAGPADVERLVERQHERQRVDGSPRCTPGPPRSTS